MKRLRRMRRPHRRSPQCWSSLSGVISLKASSGHLGRDVVDPRPRQAPLGDHPRPAASRRRRSRTTPWSRLGAAHFDRGCRPCHGAPGTPPPAVPARMTPHPPDLARQVGRWRPRELFYIVAHGIKFTGMPAWPAPPRTDEAWAVVAFLRRLPQLDAPAYRALIGAPADAGSIASVASVRQCRACHRERLDAGAASGRPAGGVPARRARRLRRRPTAQRHHANGGRRPRRRDARRARRGVVGGSRRRAGEPRSDRPPLGVIGRGDPARDIPACVECHGPGPRTRDPRFPALAGQPADYLRLQLTLFAEGRRGGSPYADIMQAIAARLTPAQIDEAARAFAVTAEAR